MEHTVRLVLPSDVRPNMPFAGVTELTPAQQAQLRASEPLSAGVLEIKSTAETFEWRFGDRTYCVPRADLDGGWIQYSTFGPGAFLSFALYYKSLILGRRPGTILLNSIFDIPKGSAQQAALEDWFKDFANTIRALIPGEVIVALKWPFKDP